jgi:stage II sporulation protein D
VNGQPYRGEILIKPKADGLMVVNRVEMENYLFGVLPCEVQPEWPFEMLKAQAVAARCFALVQSQTKMSQDFDLYNDTRSQVYKGMSKEHPRTNEAVKQTRGIVALYQGQVIQAVFSAASGGKTANSEDVWGKPLPYLRSVPDYDLTCPYAAWKFIISAKELEEMLQCNGVDVGSLKNLVTIERDRSDRVRAIRIVGDRGEAVISGTKFRSMFNLKSTNFIVVNTALQLSKAIVTSASEAKMNAAQGAANGQVQNSGNQATGTGFTAAGGTGASGEALSSEKGLEQAGSIAESIAIHLFSDTPGSTYQANLPATTTITDAIAIGATSPNGSDTSANYTNQSLAQQFLALPLIELEIVGSGFGHGVGMSQWGAREMAANGSTYKQILFHYYQGIEIARLY